MKILVLTFFAFSITSCADCWTYSFTIHKKPFYAQLSSDPFNPTPANQNVTVTAKILVDGKAVKTETGLELDSASIRADYKIR